jgi:hypothetical protein
MSTDCDLERDVNARKCPGLSHMWGGIESIAEEELPNSAPPPLSYAPGPPKPLFRADISSKTAMGSHSPMSTARSLIGSAPLSSS